MVVTEAETVTSLTSTVLLLVTFTTNFTVPGRVYTVVRSASASTVRVIFWAGSRAWTDRRSVAVATVAPEASAPVTVNAAALAPNPNLYLTAGTTAVLAEKDGAPVMTVHPFGKGKAAYLSSFREGPESNRMLLELLMYLSGAKAEYVSDSALVEAAYYPADRTLVALNNSDEPVSASIALPDGSLDVTLTPMETRMIQL